MAAALILMSAWCGFVPTPLIENPDANGLNSGETDL